MLHLKPSFDMPDTAFKDDAVADVRSYRGAGTAEPSPQVPAMSVNANARSPKILNKFKYGFLFILSLFLCWPLLRGLQR